MRNGLLFRFARSRVSAVALLAFVSPLVLTSVSSVCLAAEASAEVNEERIKSLRERTDQLAKEDDELEEGLKEWTDLKLQEVDRRIENLQERMTFYVAVVVGAVTLFGAIAGFLGHRFLVVTARRAVRDQAKSQVERFVQEELADIGQSEVERLLKELQERGENTLGSVERTHRRVKDLEQRIAARGASLVREEKPIGDPDTPVPQEELAELEETASLIRDSKEEDRYTAAEWLLVGLNALNTNAVDEAVAAFSRAIEQDNAYAVAYTRRGIAHARLRQYDSAVRDFDRVVELVGDASAHFNRGVLHSQTGAFAEAVADYTKTIELTEAAGKGGSRDQLAALVNRGADRLRLKEIESAIDDFERAIAIAPEDALLRANHAQALLQALRPGDSEVSADAVVELARNDGERATGLLLRSVARLASGGTIDSGDEQQFHLAASAAGGAPFALAWLREWIDGELSVEDRARIAEMIDALEPED